MSGMQMVIFYAVISSFTPLLLMVFAMLNFAESADGGGGSVLGTGSTVAVLEQPNRMIDPKRRGINFLFLK
jgi:hypothetical protein